MKSASELKKLAKKYNERVTRASIARAEGVLKSHIEYLEIEAEKAAEAGKYSLMSMNLAEERWRKGTSFTQDEMEEFLWNGLRNHFEPLGFRCEGENSNYFTLRWGDDED